MMTRLLFVDLLAGCAPEGTSGTAQLSMTGPPELSEGRYALWAVTGDGPRLVGTTRRADASFSFGLDRDDIAETLVTVEFGDATPSEPSEAVILQGTNTELAFPGSLEGIAGSGVLFTPTDALANDEAGFWLSEAATLPGVPTLELPELPGGWGYALFVRTQETTLSAGPLPGPSPCTHCGPLDDPGVPGMDLLVDLPGLDPVDLTDGSSSVFVTIEPQLGDGDPTGEGPFAAVLWEDWADVQPLAQPFELEAGSPLPFVGQVFYSPPS